MTMSDRIWCAVFGTVTIIAAYNLFTNYHWYHVLGVVMNFPLFAYYLGKFLRAKRPVAPADDDCGITDEQRKAVILEAFRTGKVVVANIDEDGTFRVQVVDDNEKTETKEES